MGETYDGSVSDGDHLEMASLTATKNVTDNEESRGVSGDVHLASISSPCSNFFALLQAYASYGVYYAPRVCFTIAIIGLIVPSYYIVADVFFNPTEHFGDIQHDYSNLNIQSNFDSQMRNIDHWCLKGGNDSCQCEDPTQPAPRLEYRRWSNAHAGNMMQIENMIKQDFASPDIAFLGASVIEKMDGRWFGDITQQGLNEVAGIFEKHFSGKENSMTAVALGIAADMNQSVLWRILNGEMPSEFNPKIWWLELGLNDLGRGGCSEEVVVIGVLRIVEEIMKSKPNAKIVINSLFPMSDLRGGLTPTLQDFQNSYGSDPKRRWKERIKDYPKYDSETLNKPDLKKNPSNFRPRVFDKKEIGKNVRVPQNGERGFPRNKKGVGTQNNGGRDGADNDKDIGKNGERGSPRNKKGAGTQNNGGRVGADNDKGIGKNIPKNGERDLPRNNEGTGTRNSGGRDGADNNNGRTLMRERTPKDGDGFRNRNREYEKLLDRTSQHKFNPVTRREQKLPLWTSIRAVNRAIRTFCDKNENVFFFDSTSIFTEKDGWDYNLKTDMITRRGFPTNAGYVEWENAVATRAKQLLGYSE